jgi:hypothetical protein
MKEELHVLVQNKIESGTFCPEINELKRMRKQRLSMNDKTDFINLNKQQVVL